MPRDFGVLAQKNPATVSAMFFYSPGNNEKADIDKIIVTNVSAGTHNFSIYLNGRRQRNAIFWNVGQKGNTTTTLDGLRLDERDRLFVQSHTERAFTFTLIGAEK